jgi:beta-barrel assembly-enhancing protease
MRRTLSYLFVLFLACSVALAADSAPKDSSQNGVKTYKDGGEKDLNAIGNRNVGCGRGVGNWYSLDKQVQMGKQYSQQIESTVKLINDPVITEYVNRLGQNLVRNSDSQVPFTIKVIDDDTANAMALPGGFFYVNSGLILAADNEAEVAGVMAHEIAHVAACHIAREQTRGNLAQLASLPLIFVPMGAGAYYGLQAATSFGVPAAFMKFSRNFEADADYLGIEYLYKAGYDPQAFTAFMEKVQAMEKKKPGFISKAFDTHPQTPDRVQKSQQEIATLLPPKDEYKVDSSEFEDVKARLNAFENRRKLQEKDDKAPSLRRAGRSSGNSGDDSDHPVLRRRDDAGASQPSGTTGGGTSGDDNGGPPVLKRPPQQ